MNKDRIWGALKRATGERTRDWRSKPIRQRPPMPIAEFAEAAGLETDPTTLLHLEGVRRAVGRYYGLPAEALHPQDLAAELRQLTGKECELFELLLLAEDALGRPMGEAALPAGPPPQSVGDMVSRLLRALEE